VNSHSLLDLPGLLRRVQPARVRIDGQVLDVPAQRKRWQTVLGTIRDAAPQEIELLDDTGNVIARIDADGSDTDDTEDTPAMGPSMVPELLAFMQQMQQNYRELFEQQRKVTEHAVETAQALVEAQGGALTDAHKRLTAVERLILRDRERFTLAADDQVEGEDEDQSSLITNLGEIAGALKYAPMLAPLVGQFGQFLKGAGPGVSK
jgi:hypothetical protein